MNKFFNSKILYLIPAIFFIVIVFKIGFAYFELKTKECDFAKKEAQVLNSYAMTHRAYYQKLFVNKILTLNDKTLLALPAYSSHLINKSFSKENPCSYTCCAFKFLGTK